MRRSLVLLCLSVAALGVGVPAAHAYPLCYRVWTQGSQIPNRDTGPTCIAYDYGTECWESGSGYNHDVELWADFCYPIVI